jgi:hypothetical protein
MVHDGRNVFLAEWWSLVVRWSIYLSLVIVVQDILVNA